MTWDIVGQHSYSKMVNEYEQIAFLSAALLWIKPFNNCKHCHESSCAYICSLIHIRWKTKWRIHYDLESKVYSIISFMKEKCNICHHNTSQDHCWHVAFCTISTYCRALWNQWYIFHSLLLFPPIFTLQIALTLCSDLISLHISHNLFF